MDYSTLFVVFLEVLAFFLAIKYYPKYKKTTESFFLFFLGYTLITELIGMYTAYILKVNFTLIYNVFIIISFLFYFYWFYRIVISEKQKKIIVFMGVFFVIYGLYNFFTLKHTNFHASTFIAGALINIIVSMFFFVQLLNDKEEIEIKHNLKFWIATGLLLFNVGMVPLMLFSEQFNAYNNVRILILAILNFILYSCYSLGFILCKNLEEK